MVCTYLRLQLAKLFHCNESIRHVVKAVDNDAARARLGDGRWVERTGALSRGQEWTTVTMTLESLPLCCAHSAEHIQGGASGRGPGLG